MGSKRNAWTLKSSRNGMTVWVVKKHWKPTIGTVTGKFGKVSPSAGSVRNLASGVKKKNASMQSGSRKNMARAVKMPSEEPGSGPMPARMRRGLMSRFIGSVLWLVANVNHLASDDVETVDNLESSAIAPSLAFAFGIMMAQF